MNNIFNDFLNELNNFDYSVGLYPISDISEVKEIAETEYNFNIIEHDVNSILIKLNTQHFNIENNNGKWIVKNNPIIANINDEIEIIDFYDEIAWYSKMIGKRFKVIEVNASDVKVKRGNGEISYYVSHSDYNIILGGKA